MWGLALFMAALAGLMPRSAPASTGPGSVLPPSTSAYTPRTLEIEPIIIQARTRDLDVMARTVWGEARGEGVLGMRAVAHVIHNRTRDRARRWGTTAEQVCLFFITRNGQQIFQFSCWNPRDTNRALLGAVTVRDPQFAAALEICQSVLSGRSNDPTNGATHYHTKQIRPFWASAGVQVADLGNHLFYANVA
jgi:spore germination cell wall hydrolase CwlJ-like protein